MNPQTKVINKAIELFEKLRKEQSEFERDVLRDKLDLLNPKFVDEARALMNARRDGYWY